MPYTGEINHLCICSPNKGIYIRFECLTHKTLLASFQVHDEQTVQIRFVTVTFHTLPGDIFAVWRVLRIGIISFVLFRDIFRFLGVQVINVNIGVGRNRIFQSCLFTASVSHFVRSCIPGKLLNATPRFHWTFIRFSVQDIHDIGNTVTVEVGNKRMWSCRHPFIPMFVHQVGHDDTCGFRQVRIFISSAFFRLYL